MAGRVGRVHLVERHDQAVAEEPIPDAIDDRLREKLAFAGAECQLDQLGPGAEFGRRRGDLFFLGAIERLFLFLLFLLGEALCASGSSTRRPVRNIMRACFSTSSVVLNRIVP